MSLYVKNPVENFQLITMEIVSLIDNIKKESFQLVLNKIELK